MIGLRTGKKCIPAADISCPVMFSVIFCMNTCRQPQAAVEDLSFSNYLIKGRCGIAQASNSGYRSAAITPKDKHALTDRLGFSTYVYFPGKLEQ